MPSTLNARMVCLVPQLLLLVGTCQPAQAADSRLSGPSGPPAGETATYVLRGPPGMSYRVVVLAGGGACPRGLLPGNPRQAFETGGLLSDNGADVQQFSVSSGGSTICAYDLMTDALVAAKPIRTRPGRDRLQITAMKRESDRNVYVTATGDVGRDGDSPFADAADQHIGTVSVVARSGGAPCPKLPPDTRSPGVSSDSVGRTHFSTDLTIVDALDASPRPRVCAYLTAPRRVAGYVRPRTVARAEERLTATRSGAGSSGALDAEKTAGRILAWVVIGLILAGIIAAIWRSERSANGRQEGKHHPSRGDDALGEVSAAHAPDLSPGYEFVQRRRDEEVTFAIQRAVGTTADVYRDRLRRILEQQDGPDWLAAFNSRRRADMLGKGHGPPAAYASLEPRAVLNCLAYDLAGLQLIGRDAVIAARQLCILANASHHPDPDKPLIDTDYQRAWRLYSQITGYAPPFDTYRGE